MEFFSEEKGNRVDLVTQETISYEEFAKFRQRYIVMYCPFSSFGPKEEEEKQCVKQKIKKWFNTMKLKKQDKQKDNESQIDGVADPAVPASSSTNWFKLYRVSNFKIGCSLEKIYFYI